MKFVAMVLRPAHPEDAAKVMARIANLASAEARMRLAAEPPALLALLDEEKAQALTMGLREEGTAVIALSTHVPSDADRVVAHTVRLGDADISFGARIGPPVRVAWPEVTLLVRGVRERRTESETTETIQVPSIGMANLTDGLWVTRLSKVTAHSADISRQQVILLYTASNQVALIAEGEVSFACLGTTMQPSSGANMQELARQLREKSRGAFYDERLVRLGTRPLPFVTDAEWEAHSRVMSVHGSDRRATFDVLAEALHQAVVGGLLVPARASPSN